VPFQRLIPLLRGVRGVLLIFEFLGVALDSIPVGWVSDSVTQHFNWIDWSPNFSLERREFFPPFFCGEIVISSHLLEIAKQKQQEWLNCRQNSPSEREY
jgi:hypothetical protein